MKRYLLQAHLLYIYLNLIVLYGWKDSIMKVVRIIKREKLGEKDWGQSFQIIILFGEISKYYIYIYINIFVHNIYYTEKYILNIL